MAQAICWPSPSKRSQENVFAPASSPLIQRKPSGSESSFQSAGCSRYSSLRLLNMSWRPWWPQSPSTHHSRLVASFHSERCPNSDPMNTSFLPGKDHMKE